MDFEKEEQQHLQQCEDEGDQRGWVSSDVIRDAIIGLSDGLTVPFALTAGLSGTGNPRLIVVAGFAELASGAISMGIGGALGSHAEMQHVSATRKRVLQRAMQMTPRAAQQAIETVLGPFSVSPRVAKDLAKDLDDDRESLGFFLLKMEEGLDDKASEQERRRVWQSGLVIGLSYLVGGLIPLLPYVFFSTVKHGLACSVFVTALVLLVFGAVKEKLVGGTGGWRGQLASALSTLFVGAIAAGSSCVIVRALEG